MIRIAITPTAFAANRRHAAMKLNRVHCEHDVMRTARETPPLPARPPAGGWGYDSPAEMEQHGQFGSFTSPPVARLALGGHLQRGCRFCLASQGGQATAGQIAEWCRPEIVYAGGKPRILRSGGDNMDRWVPELFLISLLAAFCGGPAWIHDHELFAAAFAAAAVVAASQARPR